MIKNTIFSSFLIACLVLGMPVSFSSGDTTQGKIQIYVTSASAQESGQDFGVGESDENPFLSTIVGAVTGAVTAVVEAVTDVVDTVTDFVGGVATVNTNTTQQNSSDTSTGISNSGPVNAAAVDRGSQTVFGASTIGMPGPINFVITFTCDMLAAIGLPCPGTLHQLLLHQPHLRQHLYVAVQMAYKQPMLQQQICVQPGHQV
jgi:hypothetical protein